MLGENIGYLSARLDRPFSVTTYAYKSLVEGHWKLKNHIAVVKNTSRTKVGAYSVVEVLLVLIRCKMMESE